MRKKAKKTKAKERAALHRVIIKAGAMYEKTMASEKALAGHSLDLKSLEDQYGIVHTTEQDAIDWVNDERVKLPDPTTLIRPFAWKLLIMPMRPKPVSSGGIIMPQIRLDTDQYLNYVGRVAAIGPLAFKHTRWAAMGLKPEDTPQIGDWVLYSLYQYQRIDFKGQKLILLNDDSFLAIVPPGVSPWEFKLER